MRVRVDVSRIWRGETALSEAEIASATSKSTPGLISCLSKLSGGNLPAAYGLMTIKGRLLAQSGLIFIN